MQAYFKFILKHRGAVLVICLLITALSAASMSRAVVASSLEKLFFGKDPDYLRYVQRARQFGGDQFLIIAFEQPDLDTKIVRERLRRIVENLEAIPEVARVASVLSVQRLREELPVENRPNLESLASDPLMGGLLISRDGRHTAVIVEFTQDKQRIMERTPALVGEILERFTQEGFKRDDLHLGGFVAILAEIHRQTVHNAGRYTPMVAIILLLATYFLFRRLWPVMLTFIVGTTAILWTMGFAVLLDRDVNILLAACPALILLISFSDVVHLSSAYLIEISTGKGKEAAILKCASEVGRACLNTSITTFIGFLGLSLISVPMFRQLGIVLGFGVAVALILAMTLVPLILSFTKIPTAAMGVWGSQRLLDKFLRGMHRGATGHPWMVIAGFTSLTALSIYGTSRIRIETDFLQRISADNRLRSDAEYLNQHFAGVSVLDLFIEIPEGIEPLDPQVLNRLEEYRKALQNIPRVGKTLSILDVLHTVNLPGPVIQLASTVSPDLQRLMDLKTRNLRFILFLDHTGVAATYKLGEKAKTMAREILGEEFRVEPSGFFYLAGGWLKKLFGSQRRALWITFVTMAATMVFIFRSLTMGLWSMVPNLIPVLVLGGFLGLFFGSIDSDVTAIALISIGIAVDDTIHFLTRCKVAAGAGSPRELLKQAYSYAGRAIIMTSLIFAFGFAPFALSDYLTLRMIGLFIPFVMIVALLADLLLLPALIAVRAIRVR